MGSRRPLCRLRSAMSSGGLYFKPPNDLTQRIRLALHEADKAGRHPSASVRELPQRIPSQELPRRTTWRFPLAVTGIAAAAIIALVAGIALWLAPPVSRPSPDGLLTHGVLASHARPRIGHH